MLDLAMDIPMLLDTTTLARGLLMLNLRLILRLPFFTVPMDMADMAWDMLDMDMLDLAMDIPMLLDTTTLARDLPMLSQRPRLTPPFCTPLTNMVCLMLDTLDMLDMAMLPLTLMAMLAILMPGENKLFQ